MAGPTLLNIELNLIVLFTDVAPSTTTPVPLLKPIIFSLPETPMILLEAPADIRTPFPVFGMLIASVMSTPMLFP
jgi:hypothetical protein